MLAPDGRFARLDALIEEDGTVALVGADGQVLRGRATRIVYSAETADQFEQAERVVYDSVGGLALAPRVEQGWKTYNFEVEELHTYVAGGVRVHNHSLPDTFYQMIVENPGLFDRFRGVDGGISQEALNESVSWIDGNTQRGYLVANDGTLYFFEKDVTTGSVTNTRVVRSFNDGAREIEVAFDVAPGTSLSRVTPVEVRYDDTVVATAGSIGGTLGSAIGRLMGGNNFVVNTLAGTVFGAMGTIVGQTIGRALTADFRLLDADAATGLSSLEIAWKDSVKNVGGVVLSTMQSQMTSAVSGFLMAELAKAWGLKGFTAQTFTAVGGYITNQALTNLGAAVLGNTSIDTALTSAFKLDALQLTTVVGGAWGSYLGAKALPATNVAGEIVGSIGSSVGSLVGSTAIASVLTALGSFAGPVGAFVGAFVGKVAGTAIGNGMADQEAWAAIAVDPASDKFILSGTGAKNGGSASTFANIASAAAETASGIVAAAKGDLMTGSTAVYQYKGSTYWLKVSHETDAYYLQSTNIASSQYQSRWMNSLDHASIQLAKSAQIIGGNAYVKHALLVSAATTAGELALDVQVARDYTTYLANAPTIHALMAAAPNSSFANGWVQTLARAEALGLNLISAQTELDLMGTLKAKGFGDWLGWTPSVDPSDRGVLVLTDPWNAPDNVRVDDYFFPGQKRVVAGTAAGETISVPVAATYGVTSVDAGAGNDVVYGHSGTDLIAGNLGADNLYGGDGQDWLDGGFDNDALYGGGGDDLLNGGQNNDVLDGGPGDDVYFDDAGNDIFKIEQWARQDTILGTRFGGVAQDDQIQLAFGLYIDATTREGVDLRVRYSYDNLGGSFLVKDYFTAPAMIDRITSYDRNSNALLTKTAAAIWQDAQGGVSGTDAPDTLVTASTDGENVGRTVSVDLYARYSWTSQSTWTNQYGSQLRSAMINDDGSGTDTTYDALGMAAWASSVKTYAASGLLIVETQYMDDGVSVHAYGGPGGDVVNGVNGNDEISGRGGVDYLYGGAGDDTLYGGGGADYLYGGVGRDALNGGTEFDFAAYNDGSAPYGVVASLYNSAVNTNSAAGDTYVGVEGLIGSEAADVLSGDSSANQLYGLGGVDQIYGNAGNDVLYGGGGADKLYGNDGADTIYGEDDADLIYGGAGADVLGGGAGADTIYGEADGDSITGGDGNDAINGGAGADTIQGEAGADWIDGAADNDVISGQAGSDTIYGGLGGDWISGGLDGDLIGGNAGTDTLNGDDGNDSLYGDQDADTLYGGNGADLLVGGSGADKLYGGMDGDTFEFSASDIVLGGRDIIYDFGSVSWNYDSIRMKGLAGYSYSMVDASGGVVITVASAAGWGDILVQNTTVAQMWSQVAWLQ